MTGPDCVFQVWQRGAYLRPKVELPIVHRDFKFVTREEADFAVRRVGSRAGAVTTNVCDVNKNSHYFLRANESAEELLASFRAIDFSEVKARTAGPASVAKTEIVALYSALKANSG